MSQVQSRGIEAQLEPEIELSQEQEDIEQENEAKQRGHYYLNADGSGYWGPALAEAEAISGAVQVDQSGVLVAGTIDPVTLEPIGDGIDAATRADAEAELEQSAVQDNVNRQNAATNLNFTATPSFTNTRLDGETQSTFSNTDGISIPASGTSGPAGPYPSTINVSGLNGFTNDVNVTLNDLTHTWPGDIDILSCPERRQHDPLSDAGRLRLT